MRGVLLGMLLGAGVEAGAQRLVVADIESHMPLRDILAYTDDQQTAKSAWDGTFILREGYGRIGLTHPNYEKRYVLSSELKGDTLYLIPKLNALREVVVYGKHRDLTEKMNVKMPKTEAQLLVANPHGFSALGFLFLIADELWMKKARHKQELKKQKYRQMMDNY